LAAVSWIGLGKLGAPCAMALYHLAGHDVVGYDVDRARVEQMFSEGGDQGEQGFADLIDRGPLKLAHTIGEAVAHADVVFVAVQTPHAHRYGGETPVPDDTRDFEYAYLTQAVRDVCRAAAEQAKRITLVVVSTVLPGTTNAHLRGLLNEFVTLVYSPLFIAMSTTLRDFQHPEFVLMGADRPEHVEPVKQVYAALHDRPAHVTTIDSAEFIKVAYNTFISMKIVWANTVMEICHKTGADCDDVVDALSKATDRIVSPAYMRGGMGDGGACHPRDLIALADLSRRLDISGNLFAFLARARDEQSQWLADLAADWSDLTGLPVYVLGRSYKPGTALTSGSPALLLAHQLTQSGSRYLGTYEPHHAGDREPDERAVYVVATKHPEFAAKRFQPGSVVIDPHGYIPDQPGVTVIRVGRKR
jgi:UDPglucose 6-dehydrogenase